MKTSPITPESIFAKKQILTLKKANDLIGRRIAITSCEHRTNEPSVRFLTISRMVSDWDLAKERRYENPGSFDNVQEYWLSYMSADQVFVQKSRIALVGEDNDIYATAYGEPSLSFFDEITFFGSDADRPIFFVELD
jgi:hypothetical protein